MVYRHTIDLQIKINKHNNQFICRKNTNNCYKPTLCKNIS